MERGLIISSVSFNSISYPYFFIFFRESRVETLYRVWRHEKEEME